MKIQLQIETYEDATYFQFPGATLSVSSIHRELNFNVDDEWFCRIITNANQLRHMKAIRHAKDLEFKIFEATINLKKELRDAMKFL